MRPTWMPGLLLFDCPIFQNEVDVKNRIGHLFNDRKRDREIHGSIRRRLDHEGHGRLRRVRCSVEQGTVTLRGVVSSAEDQRVAESIVRRCPDVDAVVNRIQVQSGPAENVRPAATPGQSNAD